MRKKKLAALFAIPVSTLLVIVGTQSSIIASAIQVEGVGETPITTEASADTIEMCGWRISGVDPSITLANTDPTLEYVGSEYALAGEDDNILIYLSGGETESTRCSFSGDYKGAQVKVSWTGSTFTSSPDTSLNWNTSDKALTIAYTDTGCSADWVTESSVSINAAFETGDEVIPAKILAASVDTALEYSPDSVSSPTFPSCGFSADYSTAIPSGKVPTAPGTTYSFTGPTLTSTLVLEP
jgi:hypothetical protein